MQFLRDKIKELDIRIIDLAEYLEVSRPTIYKYIELYDSGHKKDIDNKVLCLFDYIQNNDNLGKNSVIKYIINNISKDSDIPLEEDKRLKIKSLLSKQNKSKEEFIYILTETDYFDPILDYLIECSNLLSKKEKTEKEIEKLLPLINFYKSQKIKLKGV